LIKKKVDGKWCQQYIMRHNIYFTW